MKVLGLSGENYICHVSHDELESFLTPTMVVLIG